MPPSVAWNEPLKLCLDIMELRNHQRIKSRYDAVVNKPDQLKALTESVGQESMNRFFRVQTETVRIAAEAAIAHRNGHPCRRQAADIAAEDARRTSTAGRLREQGG